MNGKHAHTAISNLLSFCPGHGLGKLVEQICCLRSKLRTVAFQICLFLKFTKIRRNFRVQLSDV